MNSSAAPTRPFRQARSCKSPREKRDFIILPKEKRITEWSRILAFWDSWTAWSLGRLPRIGAQRSSGLAAKSWALEWAVLGRG